MGPWSAVPRHDQVSPAESADAATGKTEPDDMSAFRLTKVNGAAVRNRRYEWVDHVTHIPFVAVRHSQARPQDSWAAEQ
jgi:hypothetical protein